MGINSGLAHGHEKSEPALKNCLSADQHARALHSGIDIPEQRPSFAIPLSAVGIAGKTVWILLPQGRLPFTAKIQVDLPADSRGIHMSRMEEAISHLLETEFPSITDYARELGRLILLKQRGARGFIFLTGKIPLTRTTSISRKQSLDSLEVELSASFQKTGATVSDSILFGLGVHHITACPCTQAYNAVIYPNRECPQPTHSQRSFTKLTVEMNQNAPTLEKLLLCLESSLHVTQDLLKRPDEAEIVMLAHRTPQFAEDAVRETAREVGRQLGAILPETSRVIIDSLSLESIHIHDVCCRLETTMGAIIKKNISPPKKSK